MVGGGISPWGALSARRNRLRSSLLFQCSATGSASGPLATARHLGLAAGLLLAIPGMALAQTAGQIVPETFRPAPPPTARELTIPAQPALQPQALPPGAEALTVRLGGIAVEGGLPEFQRATAAITDPLVGRVVTAAEVFDKTSDPYELSASKSSVG